MKIELRNFRHYPSLSQETNAFTAALYLDGVKAGEVRDDGQGGETIYHIADKALRDRFEAYARTLPPVEAHGMELPMDAHFHLALLAERMIREKSLRSLCRRSIVVRLKNDPPGEYRTIRGSYDPRLRPQLQAQFGDALERIVNEDFAAR